MSTSKKKSAQVNAWEDDPASGSEIQRPVPEIGKKPLAFSFPSPQPKPAVYAVGTADFRYWTTAEALRRGADFWAPRIGVPWQVGKVLKVLLDEGEDLNAYYDREALNFFHGKGPKGTKVWSGESPDVACHEMGHAILDSIKPQLWGAASHEAAGFHESFGDMSAILSALQLPSLRKAVLAETGGKLYRSSRLSRLAEQLGAAIRLVRPDLVESDCLRNAVNSFTYVDPVKLPPMAPASMLSSEPHSFSRVFTGAFYECLAGIVAAKAGEGGTPTDKHLLDASGDIADILVAAVRAAPVVPNFYSQVAAAMVQASTGVNASYPPILKAAFVRRSILSLHSAAQVQALSLSLAPKGRGKRGIAPEPEEELSSLAVPADHFGLDKPILLQAASHARSFVANAAAAATGSVDPTGSSTAAIAFLDDLFRLGHVTYAEFLPEGKGLAARRHHTSHKLTREAQGYRLVRCRFDCGIAH